MSVINPELDLIEKAAVRVGMKSLMNHGAASCVYSEGCSGVSQAHLIAFAREVALHCAAALATPPAATPAAPGEVTDEQIEDAAERNKLFMAAAGYVFGVQDLRGFVNDIRAALSQPAPVAAPAKHCEWTNCVHRVGDVCCNDKEQK